MNARKSKEQVEAYFPPDARWRKYLWINRVTLTEEGCVATLRFEPPHLVHEDKWFKTIFIPKGSVFHPARESLFPTAEHHQFPREYPFNNPILPGHKWFSSESLRPWRRFSATVLNALRGQTSYMLDAYGFPGGFVAAFHDRGHPAMIQEYIENSEGGYSEGQCAWADDGDDDEVRREAWFRLESMAAERHVGIRNGWMLTPSYHFLESTIQAVARDGGVDQLVSLISSCDDVNVPLVWPHPGLSILQMVNAQTPNQAVSPLLLESGARVDYHHEGFGFDPLLAIKHQNSWAVRALLEAADEFQLDWWKQLGLEHCQLLEWAEGEALILSHFAGREARKVAAEILSASEVS